MKISQSKLIYTSYSFVVYSSYALGSPLFASFLKPIIQKIWLISIIITFFTSLAYTNYSIKKKFLVPTLLLLSYSIVVFISYVLNFSLKMAIGHSFYYALIYFLLGFISLLLVDNYSLTKLIRPFLISSLIITVLSLLVYLGYQPTFYLDNQEALNAELYYKFNSEFSAFSGVYLNSNLFGIASIISITSIYISILSIDEVKKKHIKYLYIALAVSLLLAFLSLSRGVVAAIFFIILIFILRSYKNKSTFSIIFIGLLILLLAYIYFYQYINLFLDRVENDGSSSRTEIWSDAINTFLSRPLVGVGDYRFKLANGGSLNAHNVYIDSLASTGIISSIFWFAWVIYGLFGSVKNYFLKSSWNKQKLFVACVFMGILIHQSIESTVQDVYPSLTLFFMIILAFNINHSSAKSNLKVL